MYTVFNRFKSPLTHYLVWDTWQKFVYVYEGMRKPFFKAQISVQNVIRDNGTMSTSDNQNQKSHTAVEKASSSSSKGKWRTYLAHILLIS